MIRLLARTDVSVLITGESGTGKELIARNLHNIGPRKSGPFVAVNCAALTPGLFESELFGHGRGSFTGAVASHTGLFEQANTGTLLLDEIGELPVFFQAKLLRVLQDRQVRRVGTVHTKRVNIRFVSATNIDLENRVRDGSFRMDLFYRLSVVQISVTPLRERPRDIIDLIDHFLNAHNRGRSFIPDETRELLFDYSWPGNVRELQNELDRCVALYPGHRAVLPAMLSPRITSGGVDDPFDARLLHEGPLPRAVGYLEESLLRKTLAQTNWNKSESARKLGLSRQGLLKKLKRYGIVESGGTIEPDGSDGVG